jgi:hypothetical protein
MSGSSASTRCTPAAVRLPGWRHATAPRGPRRRDYNVEDRGHALKAVKGFEELHGARWPKAIAKITDYLDVLLTFTTSPLSTGSTCAPRIRSSRPFATV